MNADELDEIISVTETPGDAVRFEFRSGRKRTLLGLSIDEAQHEVGRVGDKLPKRHYEPVPGPTAPPPLVIADIRKFPK
jgi:hypothetical protein